MKSGCGANLGESRLTFLQDYCGQLADWQKRSTSRSLVNYSKTWSHTYVGAGVPIVDCQQEYRQVAMLGEDALTAEAQMGVNPTLSEEESTERASVSAEKIPVISITDGVVSSSPDLIHGGAASCIYVANSVALEDILSHRKPKGQGGSLLPIEEADQIQDSELEKPCKYVIKISKHKERGQAFQRETEASGVLQEECRLLRSLSHPNIPRVRATSTPDSDPFFFVLDRFDWNLNEQMKHWKDERAGITCPRSFSLAHLRDLRRRRTISDESIASDSSSNGRSFFQDRLRAAYELSSALHYLHDRDICHLNLHPGHVCFLNGRIMLIGLENCEKIDSVQGSSHDEDATHTLRGNVYRTRYTAPELAQCRPYNLKVDVYSFAVILYEIVSLTPYCEGMCSDNFSERVVCGTYRPPLDRSWPKGVRSLIEQGWDPKSEERPNIYYVRESLRDELAVCPSTTSGSSGSTRSTRSSARSLGDSRHHSRRSGLLDVYDEEISDHQYEIQI